LRQVPQPRHDIGDAEQPVEIGAADMHAIVGEDVVAPVRLAGAVGRNADDREVGRAAAHVDDQRQFFAGHLLFVVQRRRDRLVLKFDVAEILGAGSAFQLILRGGIGLGVAIDELHRPAQHDLLHGQTLMRLQAGFQARDEQADNVGERHGTLLDARLFVDQGTAEHALQRAQQAPLDTVGILPDRLSPHGHAVVLEVEEQGAGQRQVVALERDEARLAVLHDAHRRVRRAKINAARGWSHGRRSSRLELVFRPGERPYTSGRRLSIIGFA
jgi:hypothetical protein